MYLANIFIENFRGFGAEKDNRHLSLDLSPGLNMLVGENDSGKSSIVDALRLVLATRTQDGVRITDDDFHVAANDRVSNFTICCTFRNLTPSEQSRFLEWLTLEAESPCLVVTLQATRREPTRTRARRVFVTARAGKRAEGPALEGEVRDFLQATYLRPLRDAEAELSGGRGSRLSQILESHPNFRDHVADDSGEAEPKTLVGIMRRAEREVQNSPLLKNTANSLNTDYLEHLSLGSEVLAGQMGIARGAELRHILEKLELWLAPESTAGLRTRRGLGHNNLLFMAAELLLLGGDVESGVPLLLVEEPEAHLHPQLQMRLIEFLELRSGQNEGTKNRSEGAPSLPASEVSERSAPPVQILATTHSPNLASKVDIQRVVLVADKRCYPLAAAHTRLDEVDYGFLRRFLDVTKANLFFARGVMIVEGDAEALLLPAIAEKLGRPLAKHGVSLVNVGSRGLFRYSRIFQRSDGAILPIRVACVADLDLVPTEAAYASAKIDDDHPDSDEVVDAGASGGQLVGEALAFDADARIRRLQARDGGAVRTFVSPYWTLEYDLARDGLARQLHLAVQLAKGARGKAKTKAEGLTADERHAVEVRANQTFEALRLSSAGDSAVLAAAIYRPLYKKQASKAEAAEFLSQIIDDDERDPAAFERSLPTYLVEAVRYVTGASEPSATGE